MELAKTALNFRAQAERMVCISFKSRASLAYFVIASSLSLVSSVSALQRSNSGFNRIKEDEQPNREDPNYYDN